MEVNNQQSFICKQNSTAIDRFLGYIVIQLSNFHSFQREESRKLLHKYIMYLSDFLRHQLIDLDARVAVLHTQVEQQPCVVPIVIEGKTTIQQLFKYSQLKSEVDSLLNVITSAFERVKYKIGPNR